MKFGLYQPYLKERGGMEKVTMEIARRTEHEVEIVTLAYDRENTFSGFQELNVKEAGEYDSPDSFIEQALNFGLKPVLKQIETEEYDALVVSEAGFGSPILFRNNDLPVLGYCHTPLRAALPDFYDTYKQGFPRVLRPFYPLMVYGFNLLEKLTWRHYDHMFTNSELTRERVLGKELMNEEDIEVLNPGTELKQVEGEYENYFLYPSRFERYKRQDLAIKAFQEADLDGFELVLMGTESDPEYVEELREMAGENVKIETDVPSDRWEELYRNCYSVVFLPKQEDFGLVPVEAGGYSKPSIAVDEGTVSETVNDRETGVLVEPLVESIAEKFSYMADNPEEVREMGEKARKNSKAYSWNNFIQRFDDKLEELEQS